jgi:hypothetical protein
LIKIFKVFLLAQFTLKICFFHTYHTYCTVTDNMMFKYTITFATLACYVCGMVAGQEPELPTFNPGDGPCQFDAQCDGRWPGTTCDQVSHLCKCPAGAFTVNTHDGRVCVVQPTGATKETAVCPTPEGFDGNFLGALQDTVFPNALPPTSKFACTLGSVTATTSCNNVLASAAAVANQEDLYDCIPFTLAGTFQAAAQGICCPSRAFTCIQPKRATEVGINLETRYWYNSITNLCEPFTWSNKEPLSNSNNFRTIEHCMSYCGKTGRRGAPKLSARAAPTEPLQRIITCSEDQTCITANTVTFTCNRTALPAQCLSTKASTCSNSGARVYITIPETFDAGLYSQAAETSAISNPRFFWDGSACIQFTYLGQGGNFNNFLTEEDCLTYCKPD